MNIINVLKTLLDKHIKINPINDFQTAKSVQNYCLVIIKKAETTKLCMNLKVEYNGKKTLFSKTGLWIAEMSGSKAVEHGRLAIYICFDSFQYQNLIHFQSSFTK